MGQKSAFVDRLHPRHVFGGSIPPYKSLVEDNAAPPPELLEAECSVRQGFPRGLVYVPVICLWAWLAREKELLQGGEVIDPSNPKRLLESDVICEVSMDVSIKGQAYSEVCKGHCPSAERRSGERDELDEP